MRNPTRLATAIRGITLASIAVAAPSALAIDLNISGFIRQEMAYKLTDDENPFNQQGNVYNGKPTPNYVFNNILGIPVDVTRPDYNKSNDWNLMATRGELDVQATFTGNLTGSMKLRACYDPGIYKNHDDVNQF